MRKISFFSVTCVTLGLLAVGFGLGSPVQLANDVPPPVDFPVQLANDVPPPVDFPVQLANDVPPPVDFPSVQVA